MPRTDEVENLRFILSRVHEKKVSFLGKTFRRVRAIFGARVEKTVVIEESRPRVQNTRPSWIKAGNQ